MFTTSVRSGRAFAAEQKIQEVKSRIAKLNVLKMKVTPTKIISSSKNMNRVLNEKCGLSPNEIEKNLYQVKGSEHYLIFIELSEQKKLYNRLDRYNKKKYEAKRKKLRENLDIGRKVLVLPERI